MVKVTDPRMDCAAIAMRNLRADSVYKTIKKKIKVEHLMIKNWV